MSSTAFKEFEDKFLSEGDIVSVVLDGPTTFVTVEYRGVYASGKAACGSNDKYSATTGVKIAYIRAVKQMLQFSPSLESRRVKLGELLR